MVIIQSWTFKVQTKTKLKHMEEKAKKPKSQKGGKFDYLQGIEPYLSKKVEIE